MIVAAAGAAALGEWEEGALLLFLFSLGHALEHVALDRARHAIEALANLAPTTALVLRDGAEVERAVQELLRGDTVLVRPGQRIPADGLVKEGSSVVDQSAITGGSMPVEKSPGDAVFAGTVNGEALLRIASPCALAIATPSAVLAAVARAGQGGVLIKGGAHLDNG